MKPSTEAQLHRSVADLFGRILRPPTIWTTIPSGGGGKIRGAQLKAMGLKPGWPDLIVLHPGKYWTIVLGIELKAGSSQSPEQKAVERQFLECNASYDVCKSLDDVIYALQVAGVPSFGK